MTASSLSLVLRLMAAAFEEFKDGIVVEETPLLIVNYASGCGGSIKKVHENHLGNHQEWVLMLYYSSLC